ncbi:EVE domain-containing protein [Oleiharenicola lentus]|uniref:EVE domain-containing protein n=1 Tax=Oleiharenicola lentus TaxID=2508720 RepID=UPI003F67FBFE
MTTQYWLVKSEPDAYSWEQFIKDGQADWTGVRNYAARLHLNTMKVGDEVFFYHSNVGKEIVGLAKVTKTAFPDKTAAEEGWVAVELKPVAPLKIPVTLEQIKSTPALKDIPLIRQSRLSVMPLKAAEFAVIKRLGK